MTTPTPIVPSKTKALWGFLVPLIGSFVPTLAQIAGYIPAPWGPVLTGVLAVVAALTGVSVHQARNFPEGTVHIPPTDVSPSDPAGGPYSPPWPKP